MQPDLSSITFIRKQEGGTSLKYRIKDAAGHTWVAKIDTESQPETAAVRLLAALGFSTEINYLVPTITIPGKGTFKNVRLEARPDHIEREGTWDWNDNPFKGTDELQGLKLMSVMMNNWDAHAKNNVLLHDTRTNELHYANSDMGATFGSYGKINLPIIKLFGSKNRPAAFSKSKFIKGVKDGRVRFAFIGNARKLYSDITIPQARWITRLLRQLSDRQIRDSFRAANYSPADIDLLTNAIKRRIAELDKITGPSQLADKATRRPAK